MDQITIQKLDNLYKRYGYELKKTLTNDTTRVYALSKGVYFGADIISFNHDENEIQSTQEKLSKAGFGFQTVKFNNLSEVETKLFEAFFRTSSLKERLQERYKKFASNQGELLKVNYEYINVPYLLDNGNSNEISIINRVLNELDEKGATLVIIEAAAGFGKTCTSYELINQVSLSTKTLSPIFTELSRDRRAAIFKHILDDVIINEFHSLLDETLVIHEIQSGRIPLIIDGFDELLSKEQDTGNDDFEQVETMLSTIGDLLTGNAKIILTGRKTAIFSGDSFQEWIENNPNDFKVVRYLINPPRIKDWLSDEQLNKVSQRNIPIKELANPVLLAFLRSLKDKKFDEAVENPSLLVEKYFQAILDREQERQDLRIEPLQQLDIYRKLAKRMMDFDITSDTKEWIKQLIEEQNRNYLEEVRKSYPVTHRPTLDEMTNTLSNHALLDRKGSNNNIGFINDFIFGTFLGDVITDIKNPKLLRDISNHMFELASTAYQFQGINKKQRLLQQLNHLTSFTPQEQLLHEYLLNTSITKSFKESSFSDFSLTDVDFNLDDQFIGCVFANCTFNDSTFSPSSFKESSFVNCVFKNCIRSQNCSASMELNLINCTDYDSGFIHSMKINDQKSKDTTSNKVTLIREKVFSMYFIKGHTRPRHRKMSHLLASFNTDEREIVSEILIDFQQKQITKVNGDNSFLTEEGIRLGQELLITHEK